MITNFGKIICSVYAKYALYSVYAHSFEEKGIKKWLKGFTTRIDLSQSEKVLFLRNKSEKDFLRFF